MSSRIYLISDKQTDAQVLVRAASQAIAIRHVVRDRFSAAVAAQETLVDLLTAGQLVQDATSPQQELPEPEAVKVAASGKAIKPDSAYPDEG
ncbi:MAG: hypothetical protein ACEQSH_00665 [Bacteroidia bacterium]